MKGVQSGDKLTSEHSIRKKKSANNRSNELCLEKGGEFGERLKKNGAGGGVCLRGAATPVWTLPVERKPDLSL